MLLLSRKTGQGVYFPDLGIRIDLTAMRGRNVTLGIDAPNEIKILRSELCVTEHGKNSPGVCQSTSLDTHQNREQLHTASLALHRLHYQLQAGNNPDSQLLETAIGQLERLQKNLEDKQQALPVRFKALLVEDSEHESNLLASFLRQVGFDVKTAGSSESAIGLLRKKSTTPDDMLLDLNMPGDHADGSFRQIHRISESKRIRVYGLSCEQRKVRFEQFGIRRCFEKPLEPEKLAHQIKQDLVA